MAMFLAMLMLFSLLTACGGSSSGEKTAATTAATTAAQAATTAAPTAKVPDPVTLEFFMPSPTASVNDLDLVLEEFYKQTKDTLNTKINFNFTTFEDIGNKVSLKLAAGEQIDSAFSAQWTNPNIMQMVSKGQLVNLDKYFSDDNYPGLKKAFTQEYVKNNSFMDSNNESHIYGIPFTHAFTSPETIYYRKDLAEKYGINEINTVEQLTAFFDAIVKNEKGMTPFTWNGNQDPLSDMLTSMVMPITKKHNYDFSVNAVIKEDGTAYVSKKANSWSDPEYMKYMPEPLNAMDPLIGYKMARDWYTKGYLEKDILSQKDPDGQFMAGKAAAVKRTLDVYTSIEQQLTKGLAGSKLGAFLIDPALRGDGTAKSIGSDFKAWNFACIPVTSKNVDRTMQFFNWIFSDMKNHDLFELGIQDKHWNTEGDTKYKVADGLDAAHVYNFPGFVLTWNPTMVRYDANTPDFVVKVMNNLGDTNFYYRKLSVGFSFVSDSVKAEEAKISDVSSLRRAVGNGVIENIEKYLADVEQKYEKAGNVKINEEKERQFNEFLKTHPYEGQ